MWRRLLVWMAVRGQVLLAIESSLLLLGSLWMPWFVGPQFCSAPPLSCTSRHYSAWHAFSSADIALAALAAAAIVGTLVGPLIADRTAPALGLKPQFGRMIAGLVVASYGWAAVALSVWAVQRPTLSAVGPIRVFAPPRSLPLGPVAPDWGFFVGLLAAGGVIGGGWWLGLARSPLADVSAPTDQERQRP